MSITIELDAPKLAVLEDEAASLGIPVERLAEAIIRRHLASRSNPGSGVVGDDVFRKAMEDTFRENDELYRRLAK